MVKNLCGILLISFSYFLSQILKEFSPESVEIIRRIPMFIGGASAIYYLYLSRSRFSKLMTLYSFLQSSCYLFLVNHVNDVTLLVVISLSCSFLFSYFLISEEISMDKQFDILFIIILTSRFFMSPEMLQWEIAFVQELILLFGLLYWKKKENNQLPMLVFFSLTLLFLLPSFYIFYSGVISYMNFLLVILLSAAGAGGVQFMCLSKTERGQTLGLRVYLINNVLLGFILKKEGETFPKITIFFLIGILFFFISLWLLSQIRNESINSVLSKSKTTLRGVFFPFLYLLNSLFIHNSDFNINLWIASLFIQILVLLLLKFILKKEDEDPDREGNNGEKKNHCSKREENSRKE